MLQDWQLIGIVSNVVQQPVDQRLAYLSAGNTDRSGHGEAPLVASHARNQILSFIDCFRQALELCTVSEKIRTHGQHDINRQLALLRCFEQELYERGRFVGGARRFSRGAEAEQLFELIYNDE